MAPDCVPRYPIQQAELRILIRILWSDPAKLGSGSETDLFKTMAMTNAFFNNKAITVRRLSPLGMTEFS